MEVLSPADGSEQAVRDAAAAPTLPDETRLALERELDRLNAGLTAHGQAVVQHLNWTLLAQAFLLLAYLLVLVGGWSLPLPGKRWLLAAISAYGAASLLLGYLTLRASRDRLAPLKASRRATEQALERVAARPPVFSREGWLATALGAWATRLVPLLILSGWSALTLYTLALPIPAGNRIAVDVREARPAAAPAAGAARSKAPPPRKADDGPKGTAAPEATTVEDESPLAALFRRAINAPPAEAGEEVKP